MEKTVTRPGAADGLRSARPKGDQQDLGSAYLVIEKEKNVFRKSVNYLLSVALAALVLAACNNQPQPPADTTAPTVSLTSSSTNVTAAGPVTFTATASDNVGVSKLEFFEGTTKLAEKGTAPYTFEVSYTKADNGQHSYTAKAYDAANNSTTSSPVTVTVNIAPAAGAPVITSFSADPANLPAGGGSVTLAWEVTGATTLSIDQGVGDVTGLTQKPVEVTASTTFTLTATNVAGSVTADASITVNPTPGTTGSLTVTIDGLPEDLEAAVTVSGPAGYSQALTVSATLTELTPGTYTVTAEPVPSDGDSYTPDLPSQDVSVSADNTATATVTYALVQTQFYVDPVNGADSSPGTKSEPFKTLKYALSVIQGDQTIILNAGTYDGASGEDFGYTVPEGVTIKANSSGVILAGLSSQNALTFAGSGSLEYLTFKGFATALTASSGSQTLTGLIFESNQYDLSWSGQASATLQDCISSGASYSLQAAGLSRLSIQGGSFSGAQRTVVLQQSALVSFSGTTITGGILDAGGSSSLSLTNVNLSKVDSYAIYVRDSSTQLRIQGGSFYDNTGNASVISTSGQVTIDGASFSSNNIAIGASAGSVTISNASIVNGSSYGVALADGVTFKMRNTRVAGNAYGISVSGTSGGIDLGTASDPGGNTLQDNRNYSNSFGYNLGGGWSGIVQAVGNTWQTNVQGADAAGHYSSQLLTCPGSYPSLTLYNSYCSSGSQIQY